MHPSIYSIDCRVFLNDRIKCDTKCEFRIKTMVQVLQEHSDVNYFCQEILRKLLSYCKHASVYLASSECYIQISRHIGFHRPSACHFNKGQNGRRVLSRGQVRRKMDTAHPHTTSKQHCHCSIGEILQAQCGVFFFFKTCKTTSLNEVKKTDSHETKSTRVFGISPGYFLWSTHPAAPDGGARVECGVKGPFQPPPQTRSLTRCTGGRLILIPVRLWPGIC